MSNNALYNYFYFPDFLNLKNFFLIKCHAIIVISFLHHRNYM